MIGFRIKRIVLIGIKSLWLHRLRSMLTVLGMILGVCSVIIMLAVGEGAGYEALEQIKQLGSTNIIIQAVKPPQEVDASASEQQSLAYGLTYRDAERITQTVPSVEVMVSTRIIQQEVWYLSRRIDAKIMGTVPWFPDILKRRVARGRFLTESDLDYARNVCVLEPEMAQVLFPLDDPIGKSVRVGSDYYSVVGVMAGTGAIIEASGKVQPQGGGNAVYIPLTAARTRFGELIIDRRSGSMNAEQVEIHQITVRVDSEDDVMLTAEILRNTLKKHHDKEDFELRVPLERLRAAQRIQRTTNILLGSIAAISLLVGGIGIMNIMLASITERTREIGIRRALGAKRRHIMSQFLSETVLLSGIGGLVGLGLGMMVPYLVEHFWKMKTIVTLWSLAVAFSISVAIGLMAGLYPAYRAAHMNPIEALRHE